jgi:hypothetical protein
MIANVLGVIVAVLIMVNGFAALRRPISTLLEHDPFGKRLLASRGETFTRRAYRIYGLVMVVIGMVLAYLMLSQL